MNKTTNINLRITEAEKAEIERRAALAGVGASEYLRRCALADRDVLAVEAGVADFADGLADLYERLQAALGVARRR